MRPLSPPEDLPTLVCSRPDLWSDVLCAVASPEGNVADDPSRGWEGRGASFPGTAEPQAGLATRSPAGEAETGPAHSAFRLELGASKTSVTPVGGRGAPGDA